MKEKKSGKLIASAVILFLGNVIFFLTIWLLRQYENVCFDQFLYQIKSSAKGADNSLVLSGFLYMGGFSSLLTLAEILLYMPLKKFLSKAVLPIVLVCLVLSISFFGFKLDAFTYIASTNTPSQFFEENYVNPDDVKIEFPENKRNLVFIFAESMENTYASIQDGGQFKDNYIKELTDLSKQNINFSNTQGLGGFRVYDGTSWTAGGMFSATAGITIKVPVSTTAYARSDNFMSGAVTLGDILGKNGYSQTIIMGSDAEFANRDLYFNNYKVLDVNSYKDNGKLPRDYKKWWGFEDKKLFEFAKDEIEILSESDKPFNLTLLTADTHFPNGYFCEECRNKYDEQYSNVISCSSRQINEFVEWLKGQPFYENTTVIIVGDHLTMDPEYMKNISKDYQRTVYNCIINSAVLPENEKERQFAAFDLLPTTVASLGAAIEGDRLGLGTNLFSSEQTLTEKYGYEYSNKELMKKSDYYKKQILNMD